MLCLLSLLSLMLTPCSTMSPYATILPSHAASLALGSACSSRMALEPELFEAAAMVVGETDLMAMKVTELKDELLARDELVSGNKAWLRRRLHAAIVRAHLAARAATDGV